MFFAGEGASFLSKVVFFFSGEIIFRFLKVSVFNPSVKSDHFRHEIGATTNECHIATFFINAKILTVLFHTSRTFVDPSFRACFFKCIIE